MRLLSPFELINNYNTQIRSFVPVRYLYMRFLSPFEMTNNYKYTDS